MISWLAGMSWYAAGCALDGLAHVLAAAHRRVHAYAVRRPLFWATVWVCGAVEYCMTWAVRCAGEM